MPIFSVYNFGDQQDGTAQLEARDAHEAVQSFQTDVMHNLTCGSTETVVVSEDLVSRCYRYLPGMPEGARVVEMLPLHYHVLHKQDGQYAVCQRNGTGRNNISFPTVDAAQAWIDAQQPVSA